jgi:hypothetical protein
VRTKNFCTVAFHDAVNVPVVMTAQV